jgi:hypothetical protein
MRELILERLLPPRFGPGPSQRTFFERAVPPEQHVSMARFGLKETPSKMPGLSISILNFLRNNMGSGKSARRAVFFLNFWKKCEARLFLSKKAPHQQERRTRSGMGLPHRRRQRFRLRPHGTPFHRHDHHHRYTPWPNERQQRDRDHDVRNKTGSGQRMVSEKSEKRVPSMELMVAKAGRSRLLPLVLFAPNKRGSILLMARFIAL